MTFLTMVNKVLERLREDQVGSVSESSYSKFIGALVNDAMREVSGTYHWSSLFHDVTFDVASGTTDYDLSALTSGGGDVIGDRVTTDESMLLFDKERRVHGYLYESSSSTSPLARLCAIDPSERFVARNASDTTDTVQSPTEFVAQLNGDGDGYDFKFWQTPGANRHVKVEFWTPQANLVTASTADDSTQIIVHNPSVEAYAWLWASYERGEALGAPGGVLEARYLNILGNAVEAAMAADKATDKLVLTNEQY